MRKENDLLFGYVKSGGRGWPWLEPWHKSTDYWGQKPEWTVRKWKVSQVKSFRKFCWERKPSGLVVRGDVSSRGLLCCCSYFYFSLWKLSYLTNAKPEDNILYLYELTTLLLKVSFFFFCLFFIAYFFYCPLFHFFKVKMQFIFSKIHPFGYVVLWICINAYIHITTPKIKIWNCSTTPKLSLIHSFHPQPLANCPVSCYYSLPFQSII